jgi:lysine-ketoglutarate reductase/saccharopine dehydrogenase-like protein (TIGR00300 family)
MTFTLPRYIEPDFTASPLAGASPAVFEEVTRPGVAPEGYHATSIFPEYVLTRKGTWTLLRDTRMDCVIVLEKDGALVVKEFRRLKAGDLVACGRRENGEDGIYVHTGAFALPEPGAEKFAFRLHQSRETSFSIDYDELYALLRHERTRGFILWVSGPAVVFDRDARTAFCSLIEGGYVHGLLAGNALAVHDLEADLFGTALGQEIYSKKPSAGGHYKHLDAINRIRAEGSIPRAAERGIVKGGIMHGLVTRSIPHVLAGSIRDDGPLPGVVGDVYEAQDRMRALTTRATTVIALATQLHSIAVGNMVPSYTFTPDGNLRPVYFYTVDMSEFAVTKLVNRGSLSARSILTNVQDFVVTVERGMREKGDLSTS